MDELAQSAIDAVKDGRVKIIPERYAKGYIDWLSEKRDWPIGRQLWWGHRIPVWWHVVTERAMNEDRDRTSTDKLGLSFKDEDWEKLCYQVRSTRRPVTQ